MKTSSQRIFPPVDKSAGVVVYNEKKRPRKLAPAPAAPTQKRCNACGALPITSLGKPPERFSDGDALARVCDLLRRKAGEQARIVASSRGFIRIQTASMAYHYWQICLEQLERLRVAILSTSVEGAPAPRPPSGKKQQRAAAQAGGSQ